MVKIKLANGVEIEVSLDDAYELSSTTTWFDKCNPEVAEELRDDASK